MNYQNIKIYETLPFLTKTGNTKQIKKLISNPTPNEMWFFFIKTKNIKALQEMINDKFKIDTIDTNGATIVHLCLQYKSRQLLDFAIEKNANFNQKDIFENHPLNIIFQKTYTSYFFKRITSLFDFSKVDLDYESSLIFTSYDDKNLYKIKYFIKKNPFISKHAIEKMSQAATSRNAQKNWLYLSIWKRKIITKT